MREAELLEKLAHFDCSMQSAIEMYSDVKTQRIKAQEGTK